MFILGLVVAFYLVSIVIFTISIFLFVFFIFVKYSKYLNELGIDKILILNPFSFPVKTIRKIIENKNIDKKKFKRYLSIIYFYKFYVIIGVVICMPCMYILAHSNLGLK